MKIMDLSDIGKKPNMIGKKTIFMKDCRDLIFRISLLKR